jgi:hypothetical protein
MFNLVQNPQYFVMKVTIKEGWSNQSKMAIVAMTISLIAIIAVGLLD